jgi:predicted transcriptional regulator
VVSFEFFGRGGYSGLMIPAPRQIRAARALLGMSMAELSKAADISPTGLQAIETGASDPRSSTLDRIRLALEARGIEFTNGKHPGVRMK